MDDSELLESLRKELEKKTNKDLLVDLAVKTAVLEERTRNDSLLIEKIDKHLKDLNSKTAKAMEKACVADEKADDARDKAGAIRKHVDKITIGIITSFITAGGALIVAMAT